jgi:hypothetical protein
MIGMSCGKCSYMNSRHRMPGVMLWLPSHTKYSPLICGHADSIIRAAVVPNGPDPSAEHGGTAAGPRSASVSMRSPYRRPQPLLPHRVTLRASLTSL